MCGARHSICGGYTLVELLAVLIIIGLMLGLAITRADSVIPSFEIDQEANVIAATLRDARTRAVVLGRTLRLEIDQQANEMRYFYDEPGPEEDPATFTSTEPFATKQWSERVVLDHAYIGRDPVAASGPVVLKFWPQGMCSPVRLCIQHKKGADLKRTVQLNPLTGQTTIQKGFTEPEAYEGQPAPARSGG